MQRLLTLLLARSTIELSRRVDWTENDRKSYMQYSIKNVLKSSRKGIIDHPPPPLESQCCDKWSLRADNAKNTTP